MITKELLDFIKAEQSKGKNKEEIKTLLVQKDWDNIDINKAFLKIRFSKILRRLFFSNLFLVLILLILNFVITVEESLFLFPVYFLLISILQWPILILSIIQLFFGIRGLFIKEYKFALLNLALSILIIGFVVYFSIFFVHFMQVLFGEPVKEIEKYTEYVPIKTVNDNEIYIPSPNEERLILPEKAVPNEDIDIYIKQTVLALHRESQTSYDQIGYGIKPNNGDCNNPTENSLFNPDKNHNTNISKILNSLKSQGISEMYCFSIPGETWAFSVKLQSENGYFCSDSSLNPKVIHQPISSASCDI